MSAVTAPPLHDLSPAEGVGGPPTDPAVVCFPPAGAGPSFCRFLPEALRKHDGRRFSRVLAMQYPGREHRFGEPPASSRAALDAEAEAAIRALIDETDAAPLLLGHSLGAQLAVETAHALESAGVEVAGVVVSARAEGGAGAAHPDPRTASDRCLREGLFSLGGTPADVLAHDELAEMIAAALRADLFLSTEPEPPELGDLRAPMLVLVGDADPAVPVAASRSWAARTAGSATHRVLRGDHDALRRDTAWLPDLVALARSKR